MAKKISRGASHYNLEQLEDRQLLSWGTGETAEGEKVAREAETLLTAAGDTTNALVARHGC